MITQEKIWKSRVTLQAILDTATSVIYVKNTEGYYLFANRQFEALFHIKSDKIIGKTDYDIFTKEMADTFQANDRKVLKSGAPLEIEEVLPYGDELRTYLSIKFPVYDELGILYAVCGISTDITTRKRAEEMMRETHEELERRVAERTTELAKTNEELKRQIAERELAEQALQQNLKRLLLIEELRKAHIVERKQIELRMREQADLLDKTQDAIIVRDLEDHILFWNSSAERIYGWTVAEATGKQANELLSTRPAEILAEIQETVLTTGNWSGELHQTTKEGREVVVESRWSLVCDDEGRPKAKLIINTDITEKKLLQEQFLRAQRMESIGTLASGIAHDLNNVFTPLLMGLQLIGSQLPDERNQRIVKTLQESAQRGADMVKQMLWFARGVSGQRILLRPRNLIAELEKMLNQTFPKSIKIEITAPQDLWNISGDATQLYQVLLNICVNARDALVAGGTLTVKAENIFIDEHYARMNLGAQVGQFVVITVADTGVGMSSEVLDRIFEPFFTTKEIGRGTGLGLSTTLAIVKSHGGFINVYSEPDKGTRFKIYLPAAEMAQQQQLCEQRRDSLRGQGELILVVDDEASICEITRVTLEAYGYQIIIASDGAEALALYANNRDNIKLVLMDMMMPNLDGPATIGIMRKIDPGLKIVSTSGLATNSKIAEAASVQAFLVKPYTAEVLLETVAAALRSI
ncbi:MAG: PAS domain-containing protein [Acidobacteriota bacterium]